MQITSLLLGRKSVRSFAQREVPQEDINGVIEAARWAPSNGNRQPWHYIVRIAQEARLALAPCLTPGNQWALGAPLLIIQVTRTSDSRLSNGVPYAYFDCGMSAMCLMVEAEARGLRAHAMAGWMRDPLLAELRIPAGYDPTVVIAVGYEGSPDALPEELREKETRPRSRRPSDALMALDVWDDRWSQPG